MTRAMTDYERIEADPSLRRELHGEELLMAATCAISEEMARQGLTKAALAQCMGRTRGDITQILSGARNMTLRTLAEVADALGCRVDVDLVKSSVARAQSSTSSSRRAARVAKT
jgi:transcriptional regulator with XRE-family HTH domain